MEHYNINYFGEKEIGYYGTRRGAIEYAESFAGSLMLTYKGEIVITDDYGRIVAKQKWTEDKNGYAIPSDWEGGE